VLMNPKRRLGKRKVERERERDAREGKKVR
jgi:hypothetical protein